MVEKLTTSVISGPTLKLHPWTFGDLKLTESTSNTLTKLVGSSTKDGVMHQSTRSRLLCSCPETKFTSSMMWDTTMCHSTTVPSTRKRDSRTNVFVILMRISVGRLTHVLVSSTRLTTYLVQRDGRITLVKAHISTSLFK